MNDFATTISESSKRLGQTFLLSYYLPASIFAAVNLYLIIPSWMGVSISSSLIAPKLSLPFVTDASLASLLATLLSPFLLAIVLAGLNDIVVRVFEGRYWWLSRGLLYPFTWWNRRRCRRLYKELNPLQEEYRRVTTLLFSGACSEDRLLIRQQLAGLAQQIDSEHKMLERKHAAQVLPHNIDCVGPTAFGNAYAIAEEYAYERYGIDTVLFWSRLRSLMNDGAANHSERITQQKGILDLSLNLACVFGLLTLEFIGGLWAVGLRDGLLLILTATCLLLFVGSYNSSVSAMRSLGELIRISFDFHRELILKEFQLQQPMDLINEQLMWVQLAAFLRRGNDFYIPGRKPSSDEQRQTPVAT